ncbi:MAG: DUF3285 domain-containing protein [Timaviella obliquedivisa GSE-PSE-MK23-08B]|jgi:hypothetical protein|nr:DUF3285 domain-containing protein [Timaviella obliquedivisa GSE-PSE-MK23-08B]
MNQPSTEPSPAIDRAPTVSPESGEPTPAATDRPPSYVKLAMRNMVRKGGTSLYHFALSAIGLFALLVGLAYLTR